MITIEACSYTLRWDLNVDLPHAAINVAVGKFLDENRAAITMQALMYMEDALCDTLYPEI